MSSDVTEKSYQKDIYTHLESTGYQKRSSKNFNINTCLDVELVLKFVKSTQKTEWNKFKKMWGEEAEVKFISSLKRKIDSKGTIEVLRNGFRDISKFKLFYPKPNNSLNPELKFKYNKNIFSVIDELKYEDKPHSNRIDLAIFINGIPISTIELKNTFSQGVENAIKQYKVDRNHNEPIFKNSLVHFAMSDEKIYMTTKLEGKKTRFLPFNKEITNPNVMNNYKTSYLYTEILQPNQLSRLINNFIYSEENKIIFPRFHQLECVNQLLKNPKPGNNYLIQHSAGSGKTKTIAWLAHGLLNKFDNENNRVYDMVIIISDRKVIDKQLQEQVKSIEKKTGIVEKIDKNSKQLAEALKTGTNIIVSTLQKFSFILDEIKDIESKKYAIIVDEAHSSQTGVHAKNLKIGLSNLSDIDENYLNDVENENDDEILKNIEKTRNTKNLSFFAFTATPKNKTLEMFGYKDEFGQFRPHHLYSMKQAIKEGFILDVLKNYLTYPTYFKLVKTIEDDPEFDEEKTKKVLRKFVEAHPHAINKKTEIMLNHFINSTSHKIKGNARAMVVTSSRKEAVLYKLEFDRQIERKNIPIKTLVAFTGTIEHDTIEYNEKSMNKLDKLSIREAFERDPYKILIVANKFQTGFDEPLLHTMYIDKKLNGVKAVQTLSRVNRIYPHKHDTLILDFANDVETIRKSFEPYYDETYLSEETDYHKLYDLMENIYEFYLFDEEDVEEFVKLYYNDKHQVKLHNLLNKTIEKFKLLNTENQVGFKKKLRKYQNIYSFLSQLLPFSDISLEKLFIYNKFLNKKLPSINNPLPFNVLEDVDIDSYKIDDKLNKISISLNDENGELSPASGSDSKFAPEEKTKLSQIIKTLNEKFKTDFTDNDRLFLKQVKDNMMANDELSNKIQNNSKENVEAVFDKYFNQELTGLLNNNFNFFKKINDNEQLKENLKKLLLDVVYNEQNNKLTEKI